MRILHFIRSFAYDHGAYQYLHKLKEASATYGIQHFFLAFEKNVEGDLEESSLPIDILEDINLEDYFYNKVNPDIIQFHDIFSYYILNKNEAWKNFYKLAFQRICIRTLHDYSSIVCPAYFISGETNGECQAVLSEQCIGKCVSQELYHDYMKYINSLNNYKCLAYFSKDTEKRIRQHINIHTRLYHMPPLIKEQNIEDQEKENVMVFAGRVIPQKGLDYLFYALAKMKCKDWKLFIIGRKYSTYFRKLVVYARKNNFLQNIIFIDHISQEELFEYYKQAKLMVFPSVSHETYGMSGAEAVSFGIPVLAFQIDGISEWLEDGVNGKVVKLKNVDEFALEMDRIMTDNEYYNLLREGAIKKGNEFSYEQQVKSICDFYKSLL